MCLYCQEGGVQMPEEKMVGEWALEWLEKQMQRGLSQNTEGSYRQWICQRIVPEFSDVWHRLRRKFLDCPK